MFKQKPLAAAVSLAVWSLAAVPAVAQDAPSGQIQTVEVTGIRASMAKSLAVKRDSSANVEVITAEDVGKMPDKNLADSLQRLAGATMDRNMPGDPNRQAVEGSGVSVRGLTYVRSEVNGRDAFSAGGGRSLGFTDVPSAVRSSLPASAGAMGVALHCNTTS